MAPGATSDVTLTLLATALPEGSPRGNGDPGRATIPSTPRPPSEVHLAVSGAPRAVVEFDRLDFDATPVGFDSRRTLRVWNTGAADLTVTGSVIDGDFSVVSPSLVVAPATFKALELEFRPEAIGPREGHLELTTNDAAQATIAVDLTGHGVEAIANLSMPTPPDFGRVVVGEANSATVTWTNAGNVPLQLGAARVEPPFWVHAPGDVTLAPGASVYAELGVQPNAAGSLSEALIVEVNAHEVFAGELRAQAIVAPGLRVVPDVIQTVSPHPWYH